MSSRLAAIALSAVVVAYAAALRLDAITMKYGPVDGPAWLRAAQAGVAAAVRPLRPAGFVWEAEQLYPHRDGPPTKYVSDPYTYLGFARQMTSFYAAHYREPLFVFSTRVWLWILGGQDVAVSFASATCSAAAVGIVLALGWYAFSRWVGLAAGALMAIEYDLVSWGTSGWRDEAFVAIVPLWALAMLRVARAPTPAGAVALGLAGGLALLIRITSLSFLVPGLVSLAVAGERTWPVRVRAAGLAAIVTAALAGPYVVNCWRVYGDPLYAISYHAEYYDARAGQPAPAASVSGYVGSAAVSRPAETLDTIAVGLTAYPFTNKWRGYDVWVPGAGVALSWLALAGLVGFIGTATGRLLLLVLVTSLVPFSLTWRLVSDWRFTEHAYPFFLLAAAVAASLGVRFVRWIWRGRSDERPSLLPAVAFWTAVGAAIGLAGWIGTRVLPALVFEEAAARGDPAVIEAGRRDAAFFGPGWSEARVQGDITVRTSQGGRSVIWVPLGEPGDYALRLRVDPVVGPGSRAAVGVLQVFLNGRAVGRVPLTYDPERVGSYDVRVPRDVTRAGANRLDLVIDASASGVAAGRADAVTAFKLWYVLLRAVPSG